jgi:hypothetical protein
MARHTRVHDDRPADAPPPTDEQPLGADAQFFEHGEDVPIKDQRELYDEFGNDIRMYTGEPVETEHDGVVIPEQMNVGSDNMAGSGEYPDGERPTVDIHDESNDAHRDGTEARR